MTLGTSRALRFFAYPEAVDLRKGYDGLYGLVKTGLGRDPLSGELFLFVNKRRGACKVWSGMARGSASFRTNSLHTAPLRVRRERFDVDLLLLG
jgi:transposase